MAEQSNLKNENIAELRSEFRHKVFEVLPSKASSSDQDWPVHEDHCFARIVLDNVFGGVWYDFVESRPAYKNMSVSELRTGINIADDIIRRGSEVACGYNEKSLKWRGERK